MRQAELEREIARATGESISNIRRFGFLLDEPTEDLDVELDEQGPQFIDWDEHDALRNEGISRRPWYVPTAA